MTVTAWEGNDEVAAAAEMTPVDESMLMPAGNVVRDHVRVPILVVAEEAVAIVTTKGPVYTVESGMAVMTGVE